MHLVREMLEGNFNKLRIRLTLDPKKICFGSIWPKRAKANFAPFCEVCVVVEFGKCFNKCTLFTSFRAIVASAFSHLFIKIKAPYFQTCPHLGHSLIKV